jgi:hypothetical protein
LGAISKFVIYIPNQDASWELVPNVIYIPNQDATWELEPNGFAKRLRGIIAVMPKVVTADRDVPMQWLEHAGKLFCVGNVPHRPFM